MTDTDQSARSGPSLARLADLPWNRFHTVVVLLFGMGWAMDAFEVTLIGNVLGALRSRFHLGADAMSVILAAWFAGLMLGASGFGILSDRYGRRRVFLASLVLYGIATLATAFAPSLAALLALRLLAGIGVGAEYAAINAAITELVPSRSRGRAAAIVLNFWPVGSLAAALLSWLVLSAVPPDLGWRVVFGFGGVIALSAAWLRRHLPESPRWLIAVDRTDEAHAVIDAIEAGLTRLPAPEAAPFRRRVGFQGAMLATLIRRHPGRLALGALLDFAEASGYYGLFAFLPIVVLPALHLPAARLPVFYLAGSLGALAGGFAAAALLDRIGRGWTVGGFYLATAIGTIGFAAITGLGAGAIMAGFALVNCLATGSWIAAYPTFSELFPTTLRATGIGASVAVGRIGAMASPFLVAYAGSFSMKAALLLLAGFWLLGAAVILVWRFGGGIEARGLALETIADA
ncbi:MFS transporter [Acidiphilium iwatense]|uniref:MFS transporter n=1 Tax=Acidiphilium iwatense TaxID=768198 RepID=A0ABS9DVG4_9PROT|nr:MFS transporter [Acidiphilium iwatense]MCF3946731.1 MFS transporter [Acidiphilium iwatense]